MNPDPDDIRRIIRAARPSGKDDVDPQLRAAREALAHHPELAAELEAERELDQRIAEAHRDMPAPEDLEERLVATLRETRRSATSKPDNIVTPTFTRRRWIGAAAAAVAVTAGGLWWRRSQLLPMPRLATRLAEESRNGVTLSLMSMQTDEVVGWLRDNQAPRAARLPEKLEALGRKGCHLYDIEDHPVSLECFLLPGMREIHLFTTPSSGLSGEPSPADGVNFTREDQLTAAYWSQGDQTMLLFSEVSESELSEILTT
ncbi:MAG: hypothetical protein AAGI48_10985 [Verrucomicrobiota bacterium]